MTDIAFRDVQYRFDLWAEQLPDDAPDVTVWREAALTLSHDCETLTQALTAAHLDIARLSEDRRSLGATVARQSAVIARLTGDTPQWYETLGATVATLWDGLSGLHRQVWGGVTFLLLAAFVGAWLRGL